MICIVLTLEGTASGIIAIRPYGHHDYYDTVSLIEMSVSCLMHGVLLIYLTVFALTSSLLIIFMPYSACV